MELEEYGYAVRGVDKFADLPRSEKEHLIDEWICSERDRYILKRRLLDGITFIKLTYEIEDNGQFDPLSTRQIQTIAQKGVKTLLKHIK